MEHDWDNLRYFLAVCRCETVVLAAHQLGVNVITVRRRIARLEEDCGQALFERIGGSYRLTSVGRRLEETARSIEVAVGHAQEFLSGSDRQPSGHVTVGAPDGIGTCRVAPALAKLQLSLPELSIELVTLPRQADLARREVDVAIVPTRPTGGGEHRIRSVKPITIRLYGARSYLAANPVISSIADLTGHRFVGYPDNAEFSEPVKEISQRLGTDHPAIFSSRNIMVQAQAAAQGAGLVLLPAYAAEPHQSLVPILQEAVTAHLPLWLMIHKEMARLPRVRAVAAAIAGALARNC